jgi:four helix bundle protein
MNVVLLKSEAFALEIIRFNQELKRMKQFEIANQIIRSGTSVGANIHEAQHAVSKADFRLKLSIAQKENRESMFWLNLCTKSEFLPVPHKSLIELNNDIHHILIAIMKKL